MENLPPRRRAILEALPRKLRLELERALTIDGDAARARRAADERKPVASDEPPTR